MADANTTVAKAPRYLRMAGDLRDAIMAGEYAASGDFPTESELCQRYGVSRFTVREALRRLQAEGLIERRRGSGTRVQPAAALGGALHQPLSNVGELLQYARDSRIVYGLGRSGPLPREFSEQVEGNTAGVWHSLRGIRRPPNGGPPIAVTEAFFHERLGQVTTQFDLQGGTLFSQLERITGTTIGRVTQDIQAARADRTIAAALDITTRDPVLRIIRCYCDRQGKLFEISVSHHPGDSFAYSMHIDLDS
ncbi:GntR family transcriptional regulator [Porphyrobacter sp. GA68]|uniref:GntR family transcriptional regulator n=1 Tax=Porphyrobacter sp. GA68 TaxID=2883480 RepID=UPI001D182F85|nr:GntR family transcriptional regulator [Porphyrobacter sp. GA68]